MIEGFPLTNTTNASSSVEDARNMSVIEGTMNMNVIEGTMNQTQ